MNMSELVNHLRTIRLRIISATNDPGCFPEVSARLPDADADEFSFLRLVIWSYAIFQEADRVPMKFLGDLGKHERSNLTTNLSCLRTWATHNISPGSEHDLKSVKRATSWFKTACGKGSPATPEEWKAAFDRLAMEVGNALLLAIADCELLEHEVDGPGLVVALKKRVNRNWAAHQFDPYVDGAINRLGFSAFDVVEFRRRHLDTWRKVVATADEGAVDRLLTLRVEADVLKVLGDALPIGADDVIQRLGLLPGAEVAAFLLILRERHVKSLIEYDSFFDSVSANMSAASTLEPSLASDSDE